MTPRDSESVLDQLSRLEREATAGPWEARDGEGEGVWSGGYRRLALGAYGSRADLRVAAFSRNHLRALLDTARALDMLWTYYLLPIADEQKEQVLAALRPFTTPSEQKEET